MIKVDKFLFISLLKQLGLVIGVIVVIAIIGFGIFTIYTFTDFFSSRYEFSLKNLGYVLLVLFLANMLIAFCESVVENANKEREKSMNNG